MNMEIDFQYTLASHNIPSFQSWSKFIYPDHLKAYIGLSINRIGKW